MLVRRYTMATSDQTQHLTDKDTQEFMLEVDVNPLMEVNPECDSDPTYEGPRLLLIGRDEEWSGESVTYKDSMATLNQCAATYLSDPPCFRANFSVAFAYKDADATPAIWPYNSHKHNSSTYSDTRSKTDTATTPPTYPVIAHMPLFSIEIQPA